MSEITQKPVEQFTFEEIVKHLSDKYIGSCDCSICQFADQILDKYEFNSLMKRWDYDDIWD
jgi:hypothetical protein